MDRRRLGQGSALTKSRSRTGYQFYDALIIAAALEAGCAVLFSEDPHDGQVIDGRLTIRNPFATPA